MKTIFNTYIEVESQEQADRLKQVCIDNGLPIWENIQVGWNSMFFNFFGYSIGTNDFFLLSDNEDAKHIQVTETEWMELLTKYKEEQCKKTID